LNKKIALIFFIVLLMFASIIALTQEMEEIFPGLNSEAEGDEDSGEKNNYVKHVRWFKSNSAGMPLREVQSQFVALREEFALAITSAHKDELPEYILAFFDEDYTIEVRMLYKNGEQLRTQWLFLDTNSVTRFNGVFTELIEPVVIKEIIIIEEIKEDEEIIEAVETAAEKKDEETEETQEVIAEVIIKDAFSNLKGFVELFNEESNLVFEYRYMENNRRIRTNYEYNENMLITAKVSLWEKSTGDYKAVYSDSYIYNRSLALRAIERNFYMDMQINLEDTFRIAFPRNIMDAARENVQISERLNLYPEFFGEIFIFENSKMVFETDDRGRILGQTLYNNNDEIIWSIRNWWQNERIVSAVKTEKDNILLVEYSYNFSGDRITERNYRNGILERVVRAEDGLEIEELYIDNEIVLRAIWEDGSKISESRVR